jgi:hypothetical protein
VDVAKMTILSGAPLRIACDRSPRGGKARILDYTHANCNDHTASRLFYGISAAENLLIYSADVSNAFSEAPQPKQGFYILPEERSTNGGRQKVYLHCCLAK